LGFRISQKCRDRALALSEVEGRTDLKVCPYKVLTVALSEVDGRTDLKVCPYEVLTYK